MTIFSKFLYQFLWVFFHWVPAPLMTFMHVRIGSRAYKAAFLGRLVIIEW